MTNIRVRLVNDSDPNSRDDSDPRVFLVSDSDPNSGFDSDPNLR